MICAHCHRKRRLGAASQRRRPYLASHHTLPAPTGPRGTGARRRPLAHLRLPDLPGNPPGLPSVCAGGGGARGVPAGCHPYRHRGSAGAGGTPLLPAPPACLHQRLSHPFPGIPAHPLAPAAGVDLPLAALVSCAVAGGDGADAAHSRHLAAARLRQRGAVGARRRYRSLQAGAAGPCRPEAGRYSCMSAAWRSKRTSKRFCSSICRAANG